MPTTPPLSRRLLAELLGSSFLGALVIGSGIAAQRLSPDNTGLQLFENAAATASGLFAIILMFGPVSGGHFNPVVSFVDAHFGGISRRDAFAYLPAQISGCVLGALTANVMFSEALVSISTHHRASPAHLFSEIIATLGLVLVIFALARTHRSSSAPAAVGAYIGAAYFFTSSASFANPAITIGRVFSNTFAGIAPASVPGFVIAQAARRRGRGLILRALYPTVTPVEAATVVVAHDRPNQIRDDPVSTVLFVCLQNAGRSQISRALFERAADGRHAALSAGTTPAERVHPEVIEVMRELGVDLSARPPSCSLASSPKTPTSSSRWAAAINVPTSQAIATSTGTCPTPPAARSTRSERSATRSAPASTNCSTSSTVPSSARRGLATPHRNGPLGHRRRRTLGGHHQTWQLEPHACADAALRRGGLHPTAVGVGDRVHDR